MQENKVAPRMIGVDCEMCETDVDPRALVGVSVVDEEGGVLLKELVQPPGNIVDLKTDITGLTLKDLKDVGSCPRVVHVSSTHSFFFSLFFSRCIRSSLDLREALFN